MESKKISFCFSKSKPKPSSLIRRQEVSKEETVEFITSFDQKENRAASENPPELIIPVKTNYTVAERILTKKRAQDESASDKQESSTNETRSMDDISEKPPNVSTSQTVSIESLAIQELLDDSKKMLQKSNPTLAIPMKTDTEQEEVAPDDVDYGSVPVSQFGYAMLRGMGWAPGKGVGKKQKVVEVVDLTLRPRSLGLGAGFIPDSKEIGT